MPDTRIIENEITIGDKRSFGDVAWSNGERIFMSCRTQTKMVVFQWKYM